MILPLNRELKMSNNVSIDSDNLPLAVREHLMRGQQDKAIAVLENEYGISKIAAKELIESYKENLRERKVALDIQIMNEQNAKADHEQRQVVIRWTVRGIVFVLTIALLFYVMGAL